MNTEIIVFFTTENFFRLRSVERQRERFDALREAFKAEFDRDATDADFDALLTYQRDQKAAKAERERLKLEREAAKPISGGFDNVADQIERREAGRYILTSAQNNTDVDSAFWASLQTFAADMGATILVGRMTYNKKGFAQPSVDSDELWYAPEVKPFLVEGQIDLGGFHFVADANVIPTAKHPIAGFESITPNGVGAIIPASKVSLGMTAALKGGANKVVTSTGTVTKRNYILRKAGAVAAQEHNIAALYVDTETGEFRHLEQMAGTVGFYDLDRFYSPSGAEYLSGVAAVQLGDIHAEKMDSDNLDKALQLIDQLEPKNVILHDVLDFSSRNHHNIKDPVFLHTQMVKGNTVRGDLEKVAACLDQIAEYTSGDLHIIESNHDLAINTWLKNADFKLDPINATVYLECMLALYKSIEESPDRYFNMLAFAYREIGGGEYSHRINFHETDESLVIAGVEMGVHGHNGANGSRGSPVGFRKLGVAMNTGHTHTPGINGRVYTAGVTASLEMGYNIGPSSWAVCHIVTYDNGQRQLIFT